MTKDRVPAPRAISRGILMLAQSAALAVWLEGMFTLKWIYLGCNYPVYGWPKPYRAYSECCSLEWNIDWGAYAFDMVVYFFIAATIVFALRRLLHKQLWRFNFVFWILIVLAAAGAVFQLPLYHQTDFKRLYPAHQLRPAGLALWGSGSGTCPSALNG